MYNRYINSLNNKFYQGNIINEFIYLLYIYKQLAINRKQKKT
jgi:hypothetical protein